MRTATGGRFAREMSCAAISRRTPFLAALVLVGMPWVAHGSPIQLLREISNPQPIPYDTFGYATGTYNGNLLANATVRSCFYLLNFNTGAQIRKFTSPEPEVTNYFGSLVQVGQKIAAGNEWANVGPHTYVGSVYLFDGATGQSLLTIRDPTPGDSTGFGGSVEQTAGRLFVSAENSSTSRRGRVHAFNPNTGQLLLGTIQNPESVGSNWGFGFEMEQFGNDLFISAPGNPSSGIQSGAVYLYDGATLQQKLKISDPNAQDWSQFGRSLDTDATRLLVGAPGTPQGGNFSIGEAYLFNATTGAWLRTFTNPEPNQWDSFGSSVALVGNYAVIGAYGTDIVGAAYVFNVHTGAYLGKIDNPGNEGGSFTIGEPGLLAFGNRVVLTGAYNESGGQYSAGSLYVYSVPEPASVLLLAIGTVGLTALRRGRRAASTAK